MSSRNVLPRISYWEYLNGHHCGHANGKNADFHEIILLKNLIVKKFKNTFLRDTY